MHSSQATLRQQVKVAACATLRQVSWAGKLNKVATPSATHSVDCRTHCVDATEVNSGIVSTAAQSVHTWKAMMSSSHDNCSDPRVTDRVQRASVKPGRHSAGGKDDHGTRRSASVRALPRCGEVRTCAARSSGKGGDHDHHTPMHHVRRTGTCV